MLMNMCLPKFDVYQSTVAPKSCADSWCRVFFLEKVLSDVRFEIHLVQRNIGLIEQSVRALKKLSSGLNGSWKRLWVKEVV